MSSKPNYACSGWGMSSGRKESVSRHIWNPKIHGGRTQVPLRGVYCWGPNRTYRPTDAVFRRKYRGNFEDSSERPTNFDTFTDRIFSKIQEKALDKIAESIVNPVSLSYKRIPRKMNLPLGPRIQS